MPPAKKQAAGRPTAAAAVAAPSRLPVLKSKAGVAKKAVKQPEPEKEPEEEEEELAEVDVDEEEDAEDAEEAGEDEEDAVEDGEDGEEEEEGEDAELGEDDEDEEMTAEDLAMAAEEDAAENAAEDGEDDEEDEGEDGAASRPSSKSPHALVVDGGDADAYTAAMAARGVIYLSRIPPYMKAAKLRWLIEQMIPKTKKMRRLGRIFLTPEDVSAARRRKKAGGNSGKKFVDGWVEFESKKVARWLADTFNAQPMGGPKRSRYYEDLWTLKYLKGFKWNHLTEKIAYEKQIRGTKIREEMSAAKKESEYYASQVERSNKQEKLAEKKRGQKRSHDDKDLGGSAAKRQASHPQRENIRTFHQRSLLDAGKAQSFKKK